MTNPPERTKLPPHPPTHTHDVQIRQDHICTIRGKGIYLDEWSIGRADARPAVYGAPSDVLRDDAEAGEKRNRTAGAEHEAQNLDEADRHETLARPRCPKNKKRPRGAVTFETKMS